jgi:glycosyltransferase involved in cell wall biosynthesis
MRRAVSILALAYNEEANIAGALGSIVQAATTAALDDYEIIVVDDGSTDGTRMVADSVARSYPLKPDGQPLIRVAGYARNAGLRTAYETGLLHASMPYTVWLPSDGEMAQESISAILCAVGTADLVVPFHGNPQARQWYRRVLTWGSTTQLNVLLGHSLNYFQGCCVYPTDLARRLPRTESGFFFNAEMLTHALDEGLTYTEVPLVHTDRAHGVSKAVSLRAIVRAQLLILRLFYRLRLAPLWDVARYAANGGL